LRGRKGFHHRAAEEWESLHVLCGREKKSPGHGYTSEHKAWPILALLAGAGALCSHADCSCEMREISAIRGCLLLRSCGSAVTGVAYFGPTLRMQMLPLKVLKRTSGPPPLMAPRMPFSRRTLCLAHHVDGQIACAVGGPDPPYSHVPEPADDLLDIRPRVLPQVEASEYQVDGLLAVPPVDFKAPHPVRQCWRWFRPGSATARRGCT